MGFSSLAKLSDKSHYNYNEADIIKIKDLLLQNLEEALQKFNKEIRLYKEEDINTVQDHLIKIKEENPNVSYSLLMGRDNLSSFDKWKEYESILKNVELYVYPRKIKYSVPVVLENHPRIKNFEAPLINFSSTEIRNRIKKNEEVKKLLPNKVLGYMKQKNLYS